MKRLAHGPKETRAIGRELSLALPENSVIGLSGDLGAGKTEFVKGMAEGLGATDPVTSPTFTLVHDTGVAGCRCFTWIFIAWRRRKSWMRLGFDDYLREPGICAIEWADRSPIEYLETPIRWK